MAARNFHDPTREHLEMLGGGRDWCASFSGGKDSASLVTWLEWLRRAGWIDAPRPRLVRSDTGVEEPALVGAAEALAALLERHGWECAVVRPEVHERLYCQILGRGLPPIHPGIRRMRWCTRSTKIDPMKRHHRLAPGGGDGALSLTGLRLGESAMRDGKILKEAAKKAASSCSAGGECGIPEPGEGRYSPILSWKTCLVFDWLQGLVGRDVRELMGDVFEVTRRLVALYEPERHDTLFGEEDVSSAARFGCVGCPAIGAEARAPRSVVRRNGEGSPLNELYAVWEEARRPENRLVSLKPGKVGRPGPIRVEARRRLFGRVMDIQRRAGVTLVTPEDEAFIRRCWDRAVYPRGWSAADEANEEPAPSSPLFDWAAARQQTEEDDDDDDY